MQNQNAIINAIEVSHLSKAYDTVTAVSDVSFNVPLGSICGFIGPNGSGKTTTIRMLLGLIKPTGGSGKILGYDIRQPEKYLDSIGAMIEGPAFYPMLSGRENLKVFAQLGGISFDHVDSLLKLVGLGERGNHKFKTYSLGMKQRLGIAAALLPNPKLLILDEPTNGLDPVGIQEIRELIEKLAKNGTTVFVSSHILAELEIICDTLVMYRKGKLLYNGPKTNLLKDKTVEVRINLEYTVDLGRAHELISSMGFVVTIDEGSLIIECQDKNGAEINRRLHEAGIAAETIVAQQPTLEETFFAMTGAH